MEQTNPPDQDRRYQPPEGEESEEMAHLRAASRVAPWMKVARANLDERPDKKRRFRRRKS
jgi:hypothetical protein